MNENTNGVVVPAATTDDSALRVPGREEVLKSFAQEVLGTAPLETTTAGGADPQPGAGTSGKTTDELSDKTALEQAAGKTTEGTNGTEATAEPAWTAAQLAWFEHPETAAPEFTAEQRAWLEKQESAAGGTPAVPDHLADEPELKGKLDAKTQERINGRIGKEVAKTKQAAERAETAEAEVNRLREQLAQRPGGGRPDGQTALSQVHTGADLKKVATDAEDAIREADGMLRKLRLDPAGVERALRAEKITLKNADGEEDYSPERMRDFLEDIRSNADQRLRGEVPKRAEFLRNVNQSMGEAFTVLPELKDPKSPQRAEVARILAENPAVRQFPNWPSALALMLIGQATVKARGTVPGGAPGTAGGAPALPKAKRPVPPKLPTPRGTPVAVPQERPGTVTDETVNAALGGDRKARLSIIQQFVPRA